MNEANKIISRQNKKIDAERKDNKITDDKLKPIECYEQLEIWLNLRSFVLCKISETNLKDVFKEKFRFGSNYRSISEKSYNSIDTVYKQLKKIYELATHYIYYNQLVEMEKTYEQNHNQ